MKTKATKDFKKLAKPPKKRSSLEFIFGSQKTFNSTNKQKNNGQSTNKNWLIELFNKFNNSKNIQTEKLPKTINPKLEPKYKGSLSKKSLKTRFSLTNSVFNLTKSIFKLPIFIFSTLSTGVGQAFSGFSRESVIKILFFGIFGILILSLINLQVIANNNLLSRERSNLLLNITPSIRGSIFIRDIKANNRPIEVTSSRVLFNVFIEPHTLNTQINQGLITKEQAISIISGSLNLPYQQVQEIIDGELSKPNLSQYRILRKFVTKNQKDAVEHLRLFGYKGIKGFSSWLGIEQVEVRSYPEEQFLESLGAVLGYVQREPVTRDEALKIKGCHALVEKNEQRNTVNSFTGRAEDGRYIVGIYGIEQKFCSELGGLNGRQLLGSEIGIKTQQDVEVVHGSDLFLTIDRNIQLKAQEILDDLVKANTNEQGGPRDGTIIVMDLKRDPGAILAMANYPKANPNEYYKGIEGFRNTATSVDYEVGSVIKPITVAAALNEYFTGQVDSKGNRRGISPNQKFLGYDERGKPFLENNGNVLYIRNADGMAYLNRGEQSISDCLRDSINTCLADIQSTIGNVRTKYYFQDLFLIGKPTLISLPGDTHDNVKPFEENIFSDFAYATFGFGQGFTMSPLQLVRSYTPLANQGKIIEPFLVDKIVDSNNRVIDSKSLDAPSSIARRAQMQVIEPDVARLVTEYLVNAIDQGYLGIASSKGRVPGYTVAGKTGTAQVSRPYNGIPCGYNCNTMRGIYDHTFIGYGPARNPEVIILIKLSEPNPGVIRNYAVNTLGPGFSKMMGWTLDYLGVPREPGR